MKTSLLARYIKFNGDNGGFGDYSECQKKAEHGDPIAQWIMCNMYYYGDGVPQNYAESARWCHMAATQGYADAQARLGRIYSEEGFGVEQDMVESARWWRMAAEQGLPGAQEATAANYFGGEGVPKDYVEAEKWARRAAEQGHTMAQKILACLYHKGWIGTPNPVEAYFWLTLAIAAGDKAATSHRDKITSLLTVQEIASAERRAVEWKSKLQ